MRLTKVITTPVKCIGFILISRAKMERRNIRLLLKPLTEINKSTLSYPLWEYKCIRNNCRRVEITSNTTLPQSLDACHTFCGGGRVWPDPSGGIYYSNQDLVTIDLKRFRYFVRGRKTPVEKLTTQRFREMKSRLRRFKPDGKKDLRPCALFIHAMCLEDCIGTSLTLETDESYELEIETPLAVVHVRIMAKNYFGLRHGIETLEQLIFFNNITRQIQIPASVKVYDRPSYPHRGVMLDTSRNYLNKSAIMRTIMGMGMSKLNTLHWHITDQYSFPYVSRTWPNMTRFGAYSPSKVYTAEDIKEIKEFGIYHGVRVVPELDAPAHVGEGWQWIDDALICYREAFWTDHCSAPPCGQLNPLSEKVYEVLEGLYKDMIKDFDADVFHLGGDQVNKNCWQSSDAIRHWANSTDLMLEDKMFFKLWNNFQARAYQKLKAANGGKDKQVILWTSDLTKKNNLDQLDNKTYIIQNWNSKSDNKTVSDLINAGFRVIFSHYDVHFLDCGFGSYVGPGANWCSPYNDWRRIFEYSPLETLKSLKLESKKNLIFGGEVILWSESADENSLDVQLWPRAAALAGRLWNDETESSRNTWRGVESRMFLHRDRLVNRGILAQTMAPEWCQQNLGLCRLPIEISVGENSGYIIFPN
ncbi:chitooligosaccharidolytic beta-N-acetylglucosaminidase-like isoform X1 [Cotesia glomerata]|uniref:chitooligosaccharidolytic beta-N-acetylglucosaminidase-like isoform X1 n=1 Tax=Cotesia glomerata TaxID=32391 RepID=UPI001D004D6E|nr:chitooligosaccharidolytic beta-N-acetylglucosaminidase-like isoform X1 [Cotesia glomerata]